MRLAIVAAPTITEPIDPLAEARESMAMVKAALEAGAPGAASLSKQHMDLVQLIGRLERAERPQGGKLDELSRRREARLAAGVRT